MLDILDIEMRSHRDGWAKDYMRCKGCGTQEDGFYVESKRVKYNVYLIGDRLHASSYYYRTLHIEVICDECKLVHLASVLPIVLRVNKTQRSKFYFDVKVYHEYTGLEFSKCNLRMEHEGGDKLYYSLLLEGVV